MKTEHRFHFLDARHMKAVAPASVDLVVTSPPYPMIAMWDDLFAAAGPGIAKALKAGDGPDAFERMHAELDTVWQEVSRVTRPGGIVCINIGDATRTLKDQFALYANHARIQARMPDLGFGALPLILWRKQTNAPNKFMGSGMLPPGAYVTLEHEYILIFRKGPKRDFSSPPDKANRQRSAFFWEERNLWFSDVWMDLKGTRQALGDPAARGRSAAFPFEVPYRLISMFSVKGDTVLDPFAGTGTTSAAALATGRNSVACELDAGFRGAVRARVDQAGALGNERLRARLQDHAAFVAERYRQKGPFRHRNVPYGFPVVTRQEVELVLNEVNSVQWLSEDLAQAHYDDAPRLLDGFDWQPFFAAQAAPESTPAPGRPKRGGQALLPGFASAPKK